MKYLLYSLLFIVLSACSSDDNEPTIGSSDETIESQVVSLINSHRSSAGLEALATSELITVEARTHSSNMASGVEDFGHNGFTERSERISAEIPSSSWAENVAQNNGAEDPANQAVLNWLDSEGHRENIEGNFDLTGVGIVEAEDGTLFFTQIFARSN